MTHRERMERRAEQREMWAESATAKSNERYQAARAAVDGIPFGQPILVGHHSEPRHRRAIERSDNAMRASVERQDMATRHEQVAETLRGRLETNIFSDDVDAIEQLEARISEREAACARIVEINKALRRELKAGGGQLLVGALDRIGATDAERKAMESNARYSGSPMYPRFSTGNMRNLIRADRQRLESIKRQNERRTAAEENGGKNIQRFPDSNWCQVTFAERPDRAILDALRAAGYAYSRGTWCGYLDKLPAEVEG